MQDVTIYAGTAACGLVGGAGSGGSHINVTVIGGQVGVDVSQAQPAPTLVALTLVNQTGPAIRYTTPGRQTLSVVGATILRFDGSSGPAIEASAPLSIADTLIETASTRAAASRRRSASLGNVAVSSTGPTYLNNVFFRGFDTLVDTGTEDPVVPPRSASMWTRITELAVSAAFGPATAPIFVNGTAIDDSQVRAAMHTGHSLSVSSVLLTLRR